MQLLLRPATIDDAVGIATVQVTTWHETYNGIIDQGFLDNFQVDGAAAKQRERIETDNAYRIVATIDGQVVGYAVSNEILSEGEPFPGDWFLHSLHVLPEFQGTGIGKALINNAKEEGNQRGYTRLVFGVFSKNESAKEFYRRVGAQFIEELPFELDGKFYATDYCYIPIRP